jgi:phospholipase C
VFGPARSPPFNEPSGGSGHLDGGGDEPDDSAGAAAPGGALGAALALSGAGEAIWAGLAAAAMRQPGSLPNPGQPAGTVDETMPFDHLIVVMMENHSFDNLLGALARSGQPAADGLTFNSSGAATNSNPGAIGTPPVVTAFPFPSTAQGPNVTQTWNATHEQIDEGKMDGFVASVDSTEPMGYYPPDVLPFAYSFAKTFTVANRWFCSAPCQTYPNRRFLMAGTAYGDIATDTASLSDPPPPNGTIFDRLHAYGISWRNYFTDLPQTAIIPSIIEKYPANLASIAQFFADCAAGTLPSVSFVDPEFGVLSDIGSALATLPELAVIAAGLETLGGDEEDPQDMYYGEAWAHQVLEAVLHSPAWPRSLLVYTYDEHGGYHDHVPPPAAIPPDSIPPDLGPGDVPGGYNIYGVRVPTMVASPYARPNAITNVVHDHTSVLATIEAKWNLPALTYRDANAATVMDFLDVSRPSFLTPPSIQGPSPSGPSGPSDVMFARLLLRSLLATACVALAAAESGSAQAATFRPPPVRHMFVIMLENENYASTFGDPSADPYLATDLPSQGALLEDYYATGHESNDNYISIVSGQPPNIENQADCQIFADFLGGLLLPNGVETGEGCVYPANVANIGTQLSAVGLTWKAYEEDMGNDPNREAAACGHPALNSIDGTQDAVAGDGYATRHDPFVYFHSVIDDQTYCDDHVVALGSPSGTMPAAALSGETGLATDLEKASTTPAFSFITPNLCDDGHDYPCTSQQSGSSALADIDTFLQTWVPKITASPAYRQGGLLEITFDDPMVPPRTPRPAVTSSRAPIRRCQGSWGPAAAGSARC